MNYELYWVWLSCGLGVGAEPVHIDEITMGCNLSTDKILSAISELEIYGLVTQMSGRRYKIN